MLAKSFKKSGIEPGDEIPCCISNMPELIYTMIAASKVGAKLNLFGTHLEKGYFETILKDTTDKLIIISDDNYGEIKDTVNKCGFKKKLLVSLADSLPEHPEKCDEYVEELDKYYHFDNLAKEYKKNDENIVLFDEFLDYGKDYDKEVEDKNSNLDTEFLITYTSGSTKRGFPKQIIHCNRSLIVSGYFNDLEISGSPKIPHQRGMCYIHSESNTNLVTCISDSLMKIWNVACEPVYSRKTALDVIRINNPSMIEMTTTHLIQMAKDYLELFKKGNKIKFPNMIATFAVGEGTSPGEEKLLNNVLRKAKAGSEVVVKGITLPYAPLSVGGGDCEHGGIFYNVFNSIQRKKNYFLTGKKDTGMNPIVFGVMAVMKKNPDGTYTECNYDEMGILVANSATSMVGYKNDKANTLKKIIRDDQGRDWLSCDAYGYIDKAGNVHQKDRVGSEILLNNGKVILPSTIAETVTRDSKNVLSCTVTSYTSEDNYDIPIINFELFPGLSQEARNKAIVSINKRLIKQFGYIHVLYREFNDQIPFPEAGSGKRDFVAIENMKLQNTFEIANPIRYEVRQVINKEDRENTMRK